MYWPHLATERPVEQQHRVQLPLLRRFGHPVLRFEFLFGDQQVNLLRGDQPDVDEQPDVLCPVRLDHPFVGRRVQRPDSVHTDRVESVEGNEDLEIPHVFSAFYQERAEGLLRYFYRRTADPDVAADLCAETFAAALQNVRQYDPQRGAPAQWLYGIARRQLAMFWRRRKVADKARRRLGIPREPIDEASAIELRRVEDILDGADAIEALDTLPTNLRSAVVLRVVDQLEYSEIAAELGCSPGAARVRVFRGLQQLSVVLK